MRHLYIIITSVAIVFMAGCSSNTARVDIGLNAQSQQLMAINASGYMPADCWLVTSSQQDGVITRAYYLKKAREATTPTESQKWLELASMAGGSVTMARFYNGSSFEVSVITGPFAGETLKPGYYSKEQMVQVGPLSFQIISGSSSGRKMSVCVERNVSARDTLVSVGDVLYH